MLLLDDVRLGQLDMITLASAVLCSLCEEFEEIAQKALTVPANTKELMELNAYVKKVESETMYALEKKLITARTTLAFLVEHTHLSSAELLSNTNTFTWSDRLPNIVDEHRAIYAEKRTQYEEGLKVCLKCLLDRDIIGQIGAFGLKQAAKVIWRRLHLWEKSEPPSNTMFFGPVEVHTE